MNEWKSRFLTNSLKLFDLAVLVLSFGLAMAVAASSSGNHSLIELLSMKIKLSNFINFAALLLVWHWIFALSDLYESKRLATRRSEAIDVMKATLLSTAFLFLIAITLKMRIVTPAFFTTFWTLSTVVVIAGRVTGRLFLATIRRKGLNVHYIIILGTNRRAVEFARKIEAEAELGYRLVGFVDDPWLGIEDFLRTGYQLCSDFEGLPGYLHHNVVDEVAIFLPLRSLYEHVSRLAGIFENHGLLMRFDSDILNLKIARTRTDIFGGAAQLTAKCGGLEGKALLVKRLLDIVISSLVLILLAPLLLIVAALIKATSPGPVLFLQKRVGLNKRQFVMYKFRTMVIDAERAQQELLHLNEMTGPVFKIKNDPRVTRVGRILRKTSIDELPQLFNVLIGDMSLVGPRAISVRDYQCFSEDWHRRRFSVRPGITCLWQVNGRNSIPFEQWMKLDMQYIDKWSIWLDFKILARTIPVVLKGSGAA